MPQLIPPAEAASCIHFHGSPSGGEEDEELKRVLNSRFQFLRTLRRAILWTAQPDGSVDFISDTLYHFTGISSHWYFEGTRVGLGLVRCGPS